MKRHYADPEELIPQEREFDMKKWFIRMLRLWPWFLVSLLVCMAVGWLFLSFDPPLYQANASLMVKDDKKGSSLIDNSVLKEMGLSGSSKLVENEIEILKSDDLMDEVVTKLGLYISISKAGRVYDIPVFDNEVPFTIEIVNFQNIPGTIDWNVSLVPNGFIFKNQYMKVPTRLKFGMLYMSDGVKFRCMPNTFYAGTPAKRDSNATGYNIEIKPLPKSTLEYSKKIMIEPVSKQASVINLSMSDLNDKRAVTILQTLIDVYNKQGLEDKNKVSDNTIDFLNERLKYIDKGLRGVEGAVEQFKSQNKITDISADAQNYMTVSQQIDLQKAQNETRVNIISALERDLVLNQDNPQLMPSTFGIEEPSMGALIEKHNDLVLQKERVLQKSGPQNPLLIDLQQQIKEVRAKLLSNVRSLKQAYDISLTDISRKDAELNSRIRNVPLLEKKLVQIKRDQNVQEQLYTFLLQKREEAALTFASNIEDSRTIARARSIGKVSPNPLIAWAIAIALGLSLPLGIVALKDLLNHKIRDRMQVEQNTQLPVLGTISHVRRIKTPIVINSLSRSAVAEQIRNLRTAISFTGKGNKLKTILVTSSQPGDGKSFISLNLAAAYALLNKKTVILEFDMRRPHITKALKIQAEEGISSILSGKSNPSDLLIEIPGYQENLFLLPAGYLPPNPAELISSPQMGCFIKMLNEQFDHIIIDTPPFSLVTDAMLLRQFADISIIILREGHTNTHVYEELNQLHSKFPDDSTYLLLNDVGKHNRNQGYHSAKYGKGYYSEAS